jgi:tRNA threonylcarbamoyladenosine modification (KEOPS) complex  Pcc1 subunit
MKRVMVVLEFDSNDNAEVVFTKELIQTKEDFEDCEVVGKFSI